MDGNMEKQQRVWSQWTAKLKTKLKQFIKCIFILFVPIKISVKKTVGKSYQCIQQKS